MSEDLKTILDILQNCIKNGHDVEDLCKNSPDQIQSNSLVKQFTERIRHETHSLEKMMKKILVLMQSTNDYTKWKKELQEMIDSMESISIENLDQITKALTRSASAKAKRKFEKHEKLVKDFKGDDVSMEFVHGLMDRSRKVIECLNHVISKLPKPQEKIELKSKKTLYIMGDDLQKTLAVPEINQTDLIGTVTVHENSDAQKSSLSFSNQTIVRQLINGILQDEAAGGIEVVLKYNETSNEKSINLIDFSQSMGAVSAILEISGKAQEEVEVIEINLLDSSNISQPRNLIAKVKDNVTGKIQEVDVQLVPINSSNNVHGKIVEILPIQDAQSFMQRFGQENEFDEMSEAMLIDSRNTTESSQVVNQIISDMSKNIVEVINNSISEAAARSFKASNVTTENLFGDSNQLEFVDRSYDNSIGSRNVSQRSNRSANASRLKGKGNLSYMHNASDLDKPLLEDVQFDFSLPDESDQSINQSFGRPKPNINFSYAQPSTSYAPQGRAPSKYATQSPRKSRVRRAVQKQNDDPSDYVSDEYFEKMLNKTLFDYLDKSEVPREPTSTLHKSLIEYETRERPENRLNRSATPRKIQPKKFVYRGNRQDDNASPFN